jgi:hypothetical protein
LLRARDVVDVDDLARLVAVERPNRCTIVRMMVATTIVVALSCVFVLAFSRGSVA